MKNINVKKSFFISIIDIVDNTILFENELTTSTISEAEEEAATILLLFYMQHEEKHNYRDLYAKVEKRILLKEG